VGGSVLFALALALLGAFAELDQKSFACKILCLLVFFKEAAFFNIFAFHGNTVPFFDRHSIVC